MKDEKQIIWETKKEMFNRLWEVSVGKTEGELEAALLLMKELRKIRHELMTQIGV